MNIDKILIIGEGGILGKSVAQHIEKLKEDFGENILIIENKEIIYPDNVTEDDIISIETDQIPLHEVMEMMRNLEMRKEVDKFVDTIVKSASQLRTVDQMSYAIIEEPKSNFIPTKGGDKSGRGNRKLIRK